ncbi:MAG: hypothetical protein SPE59_02135 [Treponema sp.]|nr:hypothetical protein [Treponema sp.]
MRDSKPRNNALHAFCGIETILAFLRFVKLKNALAFFLTLCYSSQASQLASLRFVKLKNALAFFLTLCYLSQASTAGFSQVCKAKKCSRIFFNALLFITSQHSWLLSHAEIFS